jgi:hypothetical protein
MMKISLTEMIIFSTVSNKKHTHKNKMTGFAKGKSDGGQDDYVCTA